MHISIKHFPGERPQFNVCLSSAQGKEPFLEVKGCRIVQGRNGDFISWPANKKQDGTYWHHVYASEAFNAAVLAEAKKSQPTGQAPRGARDEDPPF